MKIQGIVIILLLALAACQPKPEQTEVPEFPEADAVYLKLEKTFILHPDGSFEKQVIKSQKLLTQRAFHSLYGQTDIFYNPETDSVVVEQAQTITPEGKTIQVPENGYVDMIPSFATGSAQFSHLRHKAVVHTALERGAIVQSSYTVYSKPGSSPALMGHEVLNQDCPVMNFKLTVMVPKGQSIQFRNINLDSEPKIKKKGDYMVYTWEESGIDQPSAEPFGQKFNVDKKQILFSSADSLFQVFNEFTSQRAFTFETNAEMRERIKESLNGISGTLEQIAVIQKIVSEEIQTIPVPLSLTGYKIRPAIQTWNTMAGTPEEKAVLLCALIKSTGLKATPVAKVPEYLFQLDSSLLLIGNLDLLSFNMVRFPALGESFIMSTDHFKLANNYNQYPNHYFIPLEMGYSQVNLIQYPNEESQFSWDGELRLLNSRDLIGEFHGNFIGSANPLMGLTMNPEAVQTFFSGTGIIESMRSRSTFVSFQTEMKDAALAFGNKVQIQLPYADAGFGSLGIHHLSSLRTSILVLPHPIREIQQLSIVVPENFKPVDVRADTSVKNEIGKVTIRHSFKQGKVTTMRNLLIEKTLILPEEYQSFKELIDLWLNPNYLRVILEKED